MPFKTWLTVTVIKIIIFNNKIPVVIVKLIFITLISISLTITTVVNKTSRY